MGGRMTTLRESRKSVANAARESADTVKRQAARARATSRFKVTAWVQHEKRNATVRAQLGDRWYVIRYLDDDTTAKAHEDSLVSRYTTQTTGFTPKGAKRAEITEENAA